MSENMGKADSIEPKVSSVFTNGNIVSVNLNGKLSEEKAFAIKDGKFIAVGSNEEIEKYADKQTEIIDLEGKTVLPGFTDSHLHPTSTAEIINDFNVFYVVSESGLSDRASVLSAYKEEIAEQLKKRKNAKLLRGVGWEATFFLSTEEGLPTCKDLDEVCPDIPVVMRSFCHHYIWVNTKAMELAGIDKNTPEPRNGFIWHDEDGNPIGIFQETTAIDLFFKRLPMADYTLEEYKEAILEFQKTYANGFGTTLVFDALPSEKAIHAYHELAESNRLSMRVNACFYADPSEGAEQFDTFINNKSKYNVGDVFDINTVKFFIDGSGFSFFMKKPFEKEALEVAGLPEDYRGFSQWTEAELKDYFEKLNAAGFQIHVHAMGDAAVSLALDAFEYVAAKADIKKNRHVIAHIMNTDESEMKRMAKLGIIAAMQPSWCKVYSFQDISCVSLLGKERGFNQYPVGRLKKNGVVVSSGTDFPVYIPPNPFEGIQNGITRRLTKKHPEYDIYKNTQLGPEEDKMTLEEMIQSYTINGAFQLFRENITGTIEKGKSADFVILDKDIMKALPEDIIDINAESVYFKGKKVK